MESVSLNNLLLFSITTILDLTAASIVFIGALSERMRLYPVWHKVGLIVATMGLVAQAFRNIHFLMTGESPSDADMPLWVMKDAGIAIIAYTYLYVAFQRHKAKLQEAKRKPAKKVATRKQKPKSKP